MKKDNKKANGIEYTPKILADFVARKMIAVHDERTDRENIRILDPAVGDGGLLLSLLSALNEKYDNRSNNIEICGFDTDKDALLLTGDKIKTRYPSIKTELKFKDFLETIPDGDQSDLFNTVENQDYYDLIIANPPYVRTQNMGSKKAKALSVKFKLTGRIDLYYPFIYGIGTKLAKNGVAGIIVSNRFMTIKSGEAIRRNLVSNFDIIHIWDLGDTKIFDAAVLPAVILLKPKKENSHNRKTHFTSIYTSQKTTPENSVPSITEALNENGIVKTDDHRVFQIRQGTLDTGNYVGDIWRIKNEESDKWLNIVDTHTAYTFSEIGKIRVGVKTNADKVFIRDDWEDLPEGIHPEVLKPVITHHNAGKYHCIDVEKTKQILYTHYSIDGKRSPIDLDEYPRTKKYLMGYRQLLEKREYIIKAGRQWFEIWVPQDPSLWDSPKIVFRDIAEEPMFWFDNGGNVVNGDCYWVTVSGSDNYDILWLMLAIGNSSFIGKYYDFKYNNKLYAGRRRFMTQYVKTFPIPEPASPLSKEIIKRSKIVYGMLGEPNNRDVTQYINEIDRLVWSAFGF